MKNTILSILRDNKEEYISGQFLCEKLQVSRTTIWKHINALKEEGYEFESSSKKGYKLTSEPNILTPEQIYPLLTTKIIGRTILHFDQIDSTNKKAKALADLNYGEGTLIISEEQTAGRGRLGRTWISPKSEGVWMSLILRPDLDPMNIPKITHLGAAALILSLNALDLAAYIKWPNDIILNYKKICGVLTEMSGEINKVNYVVMGIGINANIKNFPEDLARKASSIYLESGKLVDRKILVAHFLNNFETLYNDFVHNGDLKTTIDICREYSILKGKQIKLINKSEEEIVTAVDINDDGVLIVQDKNEKIKEIVSGEISIRGLNGYI